MARFEDVYINRHTAITSDIERSKTSPCDLISSTSFVTKQVTPTGKASISYTFSAHVLRLPFDPGAAVQARLTQCQCQWLH